jgi:hypothetical protein
MTGMLCEFLLTKSSDLSLYYFHFFLHMYDYTVLDSRYREASDLVEDLIQEMLENLLQT